MVLVSIAVALWVINAWCVFLPFRKCRVLFDKYCGPLLNLAGLKVGIIKTEKEGQAKDIMEIMDNTDAVLVAGGDGTAAEVSTGHSASRAVPCRPPG